MISKYLPFITLGFLFVTCKQMNEAPPASFSEKHRPQYHFSPPSQWMNDPNGMFFYEDEYHLFYQYYPDSNVWGPMHWGHAVSKDMIAWEHLPIALLPDSLGYIFSGSAVVDWDNTSGFGSKENPPIVAIFTYHDPEGEKAGTIDFQYQGIAYSLDKGRSWEKYDGNPVLGNPGIKDFRDPKVIWHESSQKWIMTLAVWDHVSFYSSDDLKNWTFESDFGKIWGTHAGVWECPDLFEMQVNGSDEKRWVLLVSINPGGPQGGSATQYFVGDFDGNAFTLDSSFEPDVMKDEEGEENAVWLDHGADNYAGVTWSDVPEADGRRLFIGWMSNWQYAQIVPTYAWRSAMTLPRSLILNSTGSSFRIQSKPVVETQSIVGETIDSGTDSLYVIDVVPSGDFSVELSNQRGENVVLSLVNSELKFDRTNSGIVAFSDDFPATHVVDVSGVKVEKLQLFVDTSSIEIFINDGEIVMTELAFPNEPLTNFKADGNVESTSANRIKSIWR